MCRANIYLTYCLIFNIEEYFKRTIIEIVNTRWYICALIAHFFCFFQRHTFFYVIKYLLSTTASDTHT